ncbi:CBS domain-containing protein [Chloroflexota bacterium]
MYVGRRMTPNPVTVTPETTHAQAFKIMQDKNIRHLPILNGDRLVGIVVESDLLKAEPSAATSLSVYEIHSLLAQLKLKDIMVSPVYTVEENCPLEEAARIIREHRITGLPVMRGDRLMGIITEMDIFEAFIEILRGDERGLAFTVRLEDTPGALASVTKVLADAGGNIVSLVSFEMADGHVEVYIKEVGADQEKLEQLIAEESLSDLLKIDTIQGYEPKLFK